jgi:hypothetical protein
MLRGHEHVWRKSKVAHPGFRGGDTGGVFSGVNSA